MVAPWDETTLPTILSQFKAEDTILMSVVCFTKLFQITAPFQGEMPWGQAEQSEDHCSLWCQCSK